MDELKDENKRTVDRYQHVLAKVREIEERIIKAKIDNFYEFRKNHYNYKIEKLLLDLDFLNPLKHLGIEHVTITKDKAKNTGEIDDYVQYFLKTN